VGIRVNSSEFCCEDMWFPCLFMCGFAVAAVIQGSNRRISREVDLLWGGAIVIDVVGISW
jgi:hypothetical protein